MLMWEVIVTPSDYTPDQGRMFSALFAHHTKSFRCSRKQLQIRQAKKSMAFRHAVLFFTLTFLWLLVANAHGRRESRFPQARSPQQRPTRGIEHLKYHNMDLGTARGYGKRAAADPVNNFLLEWMALESRMRGLGVIPTGLEQSE